MKERLLQYKRKIDFICEKLENLPEMPGDEILKDAILYRVQVSIDAAMDIIAMLVKDSGEEVSDDYHNMALLADKGILSKQIEEQMKFYNGLRNAIVHKYNKFEEKEVIANIKKIKRNFHIFLECVENAIKKIFE